MPNRYRTLTTSTIASALAVPSVVLAQAPGEFRPKPLVMEPTAPTTIERNYGMQLVAADILSVVTIYAGVNSESESLLSLGTLGLLLAAPAVHLFHDNGASALRSAGLRVTLPLAGMMIGSGASSSSLPGLVIGGGIGVATALIIDYTMLGKKTEKTPASWQPTIGTSSNSFSVGAAGHF